MSTHLEMTALCNTHILKHKLNSQELLLEYVVFIPVSFFLGRDVDNQTITTTTTDNGSEDPFLQEALTAFSGEYRLSISCSPTKSYDRYESLS